MFFFLSTLVAGFLTGLACYKAILELARLQVVPSGSFVSLTEIPQKFVPIEDYRKLELQLKSVKDALEKVRTTHVMRRSSLIAAVNLGAELQHYILQLAIAAQMPKSSPLPHEVRARLEISHLKLTRWVKELSLHDSVTIPTSEDVTDRRLITKASSELMLHFRAAMVKKYGQSQESAFIVGSMAGLLSMSQSVATSKWSPDLKQVQLFREHAGGIRLPDSTVSRFLQAPRDELPRLLSEISDAAAESGRQ